MKFYFQGNAKVITQYFQKQTWNKKLRVAFFATHYAQEMMSLHELDQEFRREARKLAPCDRDIEWARWDVLAIMEEMS